MKKIFCFAVLFVTLGSGVGRTEVIEDFESYSAQQAFASPSSTPWSRFGAAVSDGLIVVPGEGQGKTNGATFAMNLAAADTGTIRYALPKPRDLSAKPVVSIDIRQARELPGVRVVCQIESAAGTIWQSAPASLSGGNFETYTFAFAGGEASRSQGSQTLQEVLEAVSAIRFRFSSETEGVSSLRFDNIAVGE